MTTETSPGGDLDPGILSDLAAVLDEAPGNQEPAPTESAGQPESEAPGSPPEPSAELSGEAPPQETPLAPGRASAAPAASATGPEPPSQAWAPPSGGQPLSFQLDGKSVTLEGAQRLPNGDVYIPATVWNRRVLGSYLADRGSWRQERNAWDQERTQLAQQNASERALLQGYLQEVQQFLKLPLDQQAEQLDQWRTELPTRALQHQLGYYQWQAQQAAQQQGWQQAQGQLEAVVPQLQQELRVAVEDLVRDPSLKVLAPEAEQVAAELWEDYGDPRTGGRLFFTGQDGLTYLDTEQLAQRLERMVGPRERMAQQFAQSQAAQARNQAATAPTSGPGRSTKGATAPRGAQGRFTSQQPPLSALEEVQLRIMGKDFLSEE